MAKNYGIVPVKQFEFNTLLKEYDLSILTA